MANKFVINEVMPIIEDHYKDGTFPEELITKFVVALNYPMTSVLYSLKGTMNNFVNVLNNLKDKKD